MSLSTVVADAGLTEVADRIWVARHAYLDVTSTVVAGERGVVVVDALWSTRAAHVLADAVRALGRGEPVALVNTHHHWDHVLGNGGFGGDQPVAVHAHEAAAELLATHVAEVKKQVAEDPSEPYGPEIAEATVVLPDHRFSSVAAIDLGDRLVELLHPGRGHTAGDAVVRVPDADLLVAGDLVEQSGPPAYGRDSFPLEWPATLDVVLQLATSSTTVVPGHGDLVDLTFLQRQRDDVGTVAETIADLVARSVPLADALGAAQWPFAEEALAEAVRRGYDQLPRTARRLPLL